VSARTDGTFVKVLTSAELPEGEGRQLVVDGVSVAVFREGGRVYALDGICPHAGSPLGPGFVSKGMVECPWHGWRFKLEDGSCPDVEGLRQVVFRVKEERGFIYVDLSAAGESGT
jgi:nitrite reductase (NADH) small subunit